MSQLLSDDFSSPTTSSHHALKPALQAVLGSLDVLLEEELARYRHQRAGRPIPSTRNFGHRHPQKTIDLISVDANEGRESSQYSDLSTSSPSPTKQRSAPLSEENTSDRNAAFAGTSNVQPSLADKDNAEEPRVEQAPSFSPITKVSSSASQTPDRGTLVRTSPANTAPDDYLESSEQLLQSLAEDSPAPSKHRSLFGNLLTPISMGSLLLLLVFSAILGYVWMNPSSISHLSLDRFFKSTGAGGTTDPETASNSAESLPDRPNLATQEFVDLDLSTLSLLKPEGSTTLPPIPPLPEQPVASVTAPPAPTRSPRLAPSPPSNAVVPSLPSNTVESPLPPPEQPPISSPKPSPVASLPSVSLSPPSATESPFPSPAAALPPSPSKDSYYYVITDYINERSLKLAQEAVPDAFVSPAFPELNRAPIQLGAFDTETSALRLTEQLQQRGIPARIYQH